jgi:RNA polymerase sigma factor (sigma-70 family)
MSDQKIIELLRANKNEKAFYLLYKGFPMIRKMIMANGGRKEDAEDMYQDALILLCKKVSDPSFVLSSALSTYLYSICRFLWKDELKKKNRLTQFRAEPGDDSVDLNEELEKELKLKHAEEALKTLGGKCLELLKLFYYEFLSMKQIALKLGFSSEKIAKNQKYKCIERAKANLKELHI